MGKIPQGILGGVSGKIGGVVGSSWKGINVIKTKPLSVANPKTAGQVAQRTKFSNTVAFATQILSSVIKPLWDRFSGQMSGYNKFIRTNIDLFENSMPDPYQSLIMSTGRMQSTPIDTIGPDAGTNVVSPSWVDDSGEGFKLATDEAFVVVLNTTKEEIGVSSAEVTRADLTTNVALDSDLEAGDVIQVWLCFRRADGTVVSNSANKQATV